MISRREVVTAGVLGTLATGTAGDAAAQGSDVQILRDAITRVDGSLDEIKATIEALRGNTMSSGYLGIIKPRLEQWVKTTGRFPEFWDVGISVWLEIYDWHVRNQQQIQIARIADQRMAIQWVFTQYVLRWENEMNYIAPQPYDR